MRGMRALRRVATPVSVAIVLGGCLHPLDEFQAPSSTDAALSTNGTTNGDAAFGSLDTRPEPLPEAGAEVGVVVDAEGLDTMDATDTQDTADACVCLREVAGKCKEWSSPACAK